MQTSLTMEDDKVKQEIEDFFFKKPYYHRTPLNAAAPPPSDVIQLSDSDDESESDVTGNRGGSRVFYKRRKKGNDSLPQGFLDPIPPLPDTPMLLPPPTPTPSVTETATATATEGVSGQGGSKQFWKAGDYEGAVTGSWDSNTGGMDHIRVHPKFLHSNATSHKWALGAFAELLDNALDEVSNGATYVNIDKLINKKDGCSMLLIEDNGGGMNPDKVRQCMSLGYSAKSKLANTIGQYGNGFKTSTMRLGADVIVFSRSCGKNGKSVTQSIGLLSYTFLRSTGKEDIVVPILDYELKEREWTAMMRSSADDWSRNVDTIVTWSPYGSETELLQQFNLMKDHGTRIIIYNLWEDDQGLLELDFTSDKHDIQIRGVNRDEKNIQMAKEYPNSRHFLTYRHSLRSYASILYLRLPPNFRMIIRGKDVEHHNIVNDMMMSEEVTYRPQPGADGVPRNADMVAIVTIGFVKDATAHIDVQGFNVYHKNRLIKPFWRVWNAAGSDGRGVIGVLEANFVEPAHDKQGFERTTVLARLENKLVQMQKNYWGNYCHKIGYAPRRNKRLLGYGDRESSPEYTPSPSHTKHKGKGMDNDKSYSRSFDKHGRRTVEKHASVNENNGNGHSYNVRVRGSADSVKEKFQNVRVQESSDKARQRSANVRVRESSEEPSSPSAEDIFDGDDEYMVPRRGVNGTNHSTSKTPGKDPLKTPGKDQLGKALPSRKTSGATQQEKSINGSMNPVPPTRMQDGSMDSMSPTSKHVLDQLRDENRQLKEKLEVLNELKDENRALKEQLQVLNQLKEENLTLQERLKGKKDKKVDVLERDLQLERDKTESLQTKLREAESKIEDLNKEQESLIDIFSEERDRRDVEEETLRKRLRDASSTIEELRERVMLLDSMTGSNTRR